jgi:hypothetical protein
MVSKAGKKFILIHWFFTFSSGKCTLNLDMAGILRHINHETTNFMCGIENVEMAEQTFLQKRVTVNTGLFRSTRVT